MSAPVAVGTIIADRYRVDGVLGQGGMGVVVRATHLLLQQQVAIKFLHREGVNAEGVRRLLSEAQAAARVQSDHVVGIHDVAALHDGTPYIVMEYLEGDDLGTLLASGPLHPRDAIRYAMQICEALSETHAAGLVHGDLKPENIYIARTAEGVGKVKLLDFGISKMHGGDGAQEIMGTPQYMAPEQFETGTVEPRTDLWALGAVLYEMLSGAPPFCGDTADAIAKLVMAGKVPPIQRANVSPGLERVIQRCLSRDPSKRHSTAMELSYELEEHAPQESTAMRLARAHGPGAAGANANVTMSQRMIPTVVLPNRKSTHGGWLIATFGALAIVGIVLVVGVKYRSKLVKSTATSSEASAEPAAAASADPSSSAAAESALPSPSASLASTSPSESAPKPIASTPRFGIRPLPKRPPDAKGKTAEPAPAPEGDRFGTRK